MKRNKKTVAFIIAYATLIVLFYESLVDISLILLELSPEQTSSWHFVAIVFVGVMIVLLFAIGYKIVNLVEPVKKKETVRVDPEIDFTLPPELTYGYFEDNTENPVEPPAEAEVKPSVTVPAGLVQGKATDADLESLKIQLSNVNTSLLKYQQIALQAQGINIQQGNEVAALLGIERNFDDAVTEVGLSYQFDVEKIRRGLKPKRKVEIPKGYQLYTYIIGGLIIFYLWRNPAAYNRLMYFVSIQRNQMFIGIGMAFVLGVFYLFGKWRGKW